MHYTEQVLVWQNLWSDHLSSFPRQKQQNSMDAVWKLQDANMKLSHSEAETAARDRGYHHERRASSSHFATDAKGCASEQPLEDYYFISYLALTTIKK